MSCFWYIAVLNAGTYQYKKSCICIYQYVPVHTGTYRYIRFCLILSRCIGFQMRPYPLHYNTGLEMQAAGEAETAGGSAVDDSEAPAHARLGLRPEPPA